MTIREPAPSRSRARVRQSDIAKTAGVSQRAVSAVLGGSGDSRVRVSPKTAQRIRRIADDLGYRPNVSAQQLKGRRSNLIGALIGQNPPPAILYRVSALEEEAARRGYRFILGQTTRDSDNIAQYVDDLLGRGIYRLICMFHELPDQPGAIPKIVSRIDHVVYLRRPVLEQACYVDIDAGDGIRQAIDHLVAQGRRRIAMQLVDDVHAPFIDRHRAYRQAMKRHGLKLDPDLIWIGGDRLLPDPQQPRADMTALMLDQFLDRGRADALITINDLWAAQAIKQMTKVRSLRVPDEVAVVGQGNMDIAELFDPEITSLDAQNPLFATVAADLLIGMIEGTVATGKLVSGSVKPRLIVRESA